jgi:hypothetical protein
MTKTECPNCNKPKKTWFAQCWECNLKEKQVKPNGLNSKSKELGFKEKFEGKFYFNSQKVKSKSELLICYFLTANGINFQYEPLMTLNKEIRPDFVIDDQKGNTIILEHFGMSSQKYMAKRKDKEIEFEKLCSENQNFYFVSTEEHDIFNLKDILGKKLNQTPLKKALWK